MKHDDCVRQGFVSHPPGHQAGGLLLCYCFRQFTHYIHKFLTYLEDVSRTRNQRT